MTHSLFTINLSLLSSCGTVFGNRTIVENYVNSFGNVKPKEMILVEGGSFEMGSNNESSYHLA